jgi:hypothetical protein
MTQTSSLTRYAPRMRDADPNGAHRIAKRQWHESGAIVLLPDQIARLPWQDRELVQRIAAKQYGPRNGAK